MKTQEPNIVLGNIFIFLYVFTIPSSCTDGSDFQPFLRKVCICSIYFQSLKGFLKTMLFYVGQLWWSVARQCKGVNREGQCFHIGAPGTPSRSKYLRYIFSLLDEAARQRGEGERSTLSAEYKNGHGSALPQEHGSDNQLCFASPYPAPGPRKERMFNGKVWQK